MRVIKQRDARDCGISCLSYIISYYDGYVPYEKLREDTYTTSMGTNAYYLLEALKKYGFDAIGKKVTYEELNKYPLPLIGHFILPNSLEHFMVITKVTAKEVTLMDPAIGKKKMKKDAFLEQWDGIILVSVPKTSILHLPKEKSIGSFLRDGLTLYKKSLFFLFFLSFLISFLTIISSFYMKISLNTIFEVKNSYTFLLISFFLIIFILKNVFLYFKEVLRLNLSKNVEIDFMYAFLKHMLHIPLEKMKNYREGEVLSRILEAREIKNVFTDFFVSLLLNGVLSLMAVLFLFLLSKKLLICLLIGISIYFLLGFCFSRRIYKLILKHMEIEANWQEVLLESIRFFPTMKHLHKTKEVEKEVENVLATTIYERLKEDLGLEKMEILKNFGIELLTFFLLTYSIYLLVTQELSAIDIITFQSLYGYLIGPLKELIDLLPKIYYLKGMFQKLSEYNALTEEELDEPTFKLVHKQIEFQNVCFAYTPLKRNLDHLSFVIPNREHVFLKGPSGSGKSTICKLLIKEIDGYEGTILIGEQNLCDYNLSTIRSNIVYLSQKEPLLRKSIKENIMCFSNASLEEYQKVCKICQIEEIVSKKSLRHDALVTDINLSGGEKQRILLARTLLKKGEIYLLDEILSEVDVTLEKKIIKEIKKYLQDKTLVYISHRDHSKIFERVVDITDGST